MLLSNKMSVGSSTNLKFSELVNSDSSLGNITDRYCIFTSNTSY